MDTYYIVSNSKNKKEAGSLIKRYRAFNDITQQELADMLQINRAKVQAIESNKLDDLPMFLVREICHTIDSKHGSIRPHVGTNHIVAGRKKEPRGVIE